MGTQKKINLIPCRKYFRSYSTGQRGSVNPFPSQYVKNTYQQPNHSHTLQATKTPAQYPVANLKPFPQKPSAIKSYNVSQDDNKRGLWHHHYSRSLQ